MQGIHRNGSQPELPDLHIFPQDAGPGFSSVDIAVLVDRAELRDLLAELRRVAAKLDRLGSQLRGPRMSRLSVRIGEASHGVHRALIALDEGPALQC